MFMCTGDFFEKSGIKNYSVKAAQGKLAHRIFNVSATSLNDLAKERYEAIIYQEKKMNVRTITEKLLCINLSKENLRLHNLVVFARDYNNIYTDYNIVIYLPIYYTLCGGVRATRRRSHTTRKSIRVMGYSSL